MSRASAVLKSPIVILLAVTLVIGLFMFRDFGLTWDEPLFYKYGDALGYAYNPANWFSGHFDLNNSYGPSGDDHKNRGPAWLLLAREPVYALVDLGVGNASAWHLLNFLCFLLGVYFIYRLAERLTSRAAAVAAAALFAFQPMLWGHAFINPKDIPFLVFLTGSVWLGFRMVDELVDQPAGGWRNFARILLPGLFLGLATANRVLGPLAGVLVVIYLFSRRPAWRTTFWVIPYVILAALVMVAAWPYLWEGPSSLLNAVQFMSDNPTVLPVLFADHVYRAYDLPRRYLPTFLLLTLTEAVWPLFVLAIGVAARRLIAERRRLVQPLLLLGWFAVPALYVIVRRPPIYDGMRHFLFILPPVFILISYAFDFLFAWLRTPVLKAALVLALLAPGILGIVTLHPYEYTYYNSFIGGTGGAFRHYETDYWLTCYKQAVESFNRLESQPVRLFVHREPDVAQPYAAPSVSIVDERGAQSQVRAGDFVLVNTRTNEDRQAFRDAPILLSIGRAGATFCVIKSIP